MNSIVNEVEFLQVESEEQKEEAGSLIREYLKWWNDRLRRDYGIEFDVEVMVQSDLSDPHKRKSIFMSTASEILKELHKCGYTTLGDLDKNLERAKNAFARYENDYPPSNTKYYAPARSGHIMIQKKLSPKIITTEKIFKFIS